MGFPRARRRLLATLGLLLLGPVCLSGYEYHPYNYGYEYYETYDLYDDYGNPTSDNGDYAPDGGEPAVSGQAVSVTLPATCNLFRTAATAYVLRIG